MSSVAVIIPCYNPTDFVLEAVTSVRAQTYPHCEITVVDDGSDGEESRRYLRHVRGQVDHYVEQPHSGVSAARNAGFRASGGDFVLPLDCDDVLNPNFIRASLAALNEHPEAGFVYTDYQFFGRAKGIERLPEYNLYDLLDQNTIGTASLVRRGCWLQVGGYDESLRLGYEDWDFWLRLGEAGIYGYHLPKALWQYRKHGPSHFDVARANHDQIVDQIRNSHPRLYTAARRAEIKARWRPAACLVGAVAESQSICDYHPASNGDIQQILGETNAPAFVIAGPGGATRQAAELSALAVWGGRDRVELADGSIAVSRKTFTQGGTIAGLRRLSNRPHPRATPSVASTSPIGLLHRHLQNSGVLNLDFWRRRPLTALGRLVPLDIKSYLNRLTRKNLFDLSFYLQFQPRSVLLNGRLHPALDYLPRPSARTRVALVTPNFGCGGAERVLMGVAETFAAEGCEILLLATQSNDSRWEAKWRSIAHHVYDLAALMEPEKCAASVFHILRNWACPLVIIQNSLAGYSAAPPLKAARPDTRIIDLVHNVSAGWDFASATLPLDGTLEKRVVMFEAARQRLLTLGIPGEKICLIPNGIDLERFHPSHSGTSHTPRKIVFNGRIEAVKRPLLLADIAARLRKLRPSNDFVLLVAGEGPDRPLLERRAQQLGVEDVFRFLGYVDDMPSLLREADLLILPSREEGMPLAILESLASGVPVVASRVGAMEEFVGEECGILIETGGFEAQCFAEALNRLLNDNVRRNAMAAASRRRALLFDANCTRALYRELLP